MSAAAKLLDRLQRVRQSAPGRWIARCPAHNDRTPSLSVRELDDGRILLNAFCGCQTEDVLAALGLTFADLFPKGARGKDFPPSHSRIPARDLLELVSEEMSIVTVIAADMLAGRGITEQDWRRLAQAAARIGRARDHAAT